MRIRARRGARSAAFAASFLLVAVTLPAQVLLHPDTAALQRVLVAEDARGTGADGIAPLIAGMRGSDTLLRRVATRGIGRLQRPALARDLAPLLIDPLPAIRREAANAIAQSMVRARRVAGDSLQPDVRWAAEVLVGALATERDPGVVDALSESLGRLPFGDTTTAQAAERAIVLHGGSGFGAMHGLYWLAANRRSTGGLSTGAIGVLQRGAGPPNAAVVRRVAVLTLGLGGALDSAIAFAAVHDPDEQVRRLGLAGMMTFSPRVRGMVLQQALADPSPIVRVAAVPLARGSGSLPDCSAIVAATNDSSAYVALTAIDLLAKPCADSIDVTTRLLRLATPATNHDIMSFTHAGGHALVALAHSNPARAREVMGEYMMFLNPDAAKAALVLNDTIALRRLFSSPNHNVQEAAIAGLAAIVGHAAESAYIAGLQSPANQVVLAAANALAGTTDPAALPALLDAFDRLSAEKRENAKDPRVAVLKRISESGSNADAARLRPYLADFDTTIARTAASTLSRWTGTTVAANAKRLPIAEEPLAQIFLARSIELKVTMAAASGGGTFTVHLFNDEAPATAARIVRLARAHYYDGHVFQRVEPDFVVQGGGPDANEYVGDTQFMRDEVTWRSQLRGTLGISSRGRDTGDAQWFFNLIDNTRLDHDYTVFGEVTSGRDVVERIMEGDVIGRVEVVIPPA
jgi:cyclophilin family peptidyl-prolyl cis-trans isomerase/HEAT repeat protein